MEKEQILVSVVTVAYNSEMTIRKTIEAVLNQTYPYVEYWIIDGASADGTVAIAQEYEEKFAEKGYRYHIISEPDAGIYDAMNKGCRRATGQIVGIINSDDWYEPNALAVAAETFAEEAYDMFYADVRLIRADGTAVIKHSRYRRYATSRDWNHPTTFVRREIYDRFSYQCRTVHDDWDLVLKVRNAGYKIVVRNEILANFRVGGESNNGGIKKAVLRCRQRYGIYRQNGMSRLYLLECIAMEVAKAILK
jgi:glycosyltransferase involved in cell wall biosynthesis